MGRLHFSFFCILSILFLGLNNVFALKISKSTVDHSKLPALNKPFNTPEEVTKACLQCHNRAGEQFRNTIHWKWEKDFGKRVLGKRHVINNY